jgi:peptidoglycan hydrolase-like amidase
MSVPSFAAARRLFVVAVLSVASAAAVVGWSPPAGAASQVYPIPASGSVAVVGHGNGHGHGMSQYGARGAALQGLTAAQIVGFYYPGTSLVTMSPTTPLRVLLSGVGTAGSPYATVVAQPSLTVNGQAVNAAGATLYRLVPSCCDTSGLVVQALQGSVWNSIIWGLGNIANFSNTQGFVRVQFANGISTDYWGSVGANISGGYFTVNTVGLDQYTQGVAPREMSASWPAAAVQSQAIAARTYAEFAREHPGNAAYDICDTTQCQVYGGKTRYAANGSVAWTDAPAVLTGNSGQVLQYSGATIFSQFSASDGGWTTDGGKPYLIAQADPYDNAASGDPYLNWTVSVPVSQLASYYGLRTVTQIEITQRDGNGDWGGRVLAGYVSGVDASGTAQLIATSGYALQAAMGLPHNWFSLSTFNANAFVSAAYPLLLGRSPDPGGLSSWSGYLSNGGAPAAFANAVATSVEGRNVLISSYYQGYLGRGADPGGLTTWRNALGGGYTPLDVQVALLSSAEYSAAVPGNQAFVDSLYRNPLLLNRSPDPGGEATWVGALNSGASRASVATAILTSAECVGNRVTAAYQLVLGRTADSGGLASWSQGYRAMGYDIGQLDAVLAGSAEFLSRFQ